jgi:8-oxo-dGTP pyrophosphatase MutT (NUDIX family)
MAKIKFKDKLGEIHEHDESEMIHRRSVYGYCEVKGEILMVKDMRIGRWDLPGGGVDEGESDEEAIIREIKEETGLKVKKVSKLIKNIISYYYALGNEEPWESDRYYYQIEVENAEGLLKGGNGWDTTGAKFIAKNELKDIIVGEDDLTIIKLMT